VHVCGCTGTTIDINLLSMHSLVWPGGVMVTAQDLRSIPNHSTFRQHVSVTKQYNLAVLSRQISCGWEGSCRSGITLPNLTDLSGLSIYGLKA